MTKPTRFIVLRAGIVVVALHITSYLADHQYYRRATTTATIESIATNNDRLLTTAVTDSVTTSNNDENNGAGIVKSGEQEKLPNMQAASAESATTNNNLTNTLMAEVESLRSQVKALLLQQRLQQQKQQAKEEEEEKQTMGKKKRHKRRTESMYAFDHNDLDAMERHTCFPVKQICTTGTDWFYKTPKGNTGAYQPHFVFRNDLLFEQHNITKEMEVNDTFFYDIHHRSSSRDDNNNDDTEAALLSDDTTTPVCQMSKVANHVVVTSDYLAQAMESYYQVTGGLYQLWEEVKAPWWKEVPSSPHVQIYALTRARPMARKKDTEEQVMSSLHALLAGFTSHRVQNYLHLHDPSAGCQCFERLIFCGVEDADEADRKDAQRRMKKFKKFTSTRLAEALALIPSPHSSPIKHITAAARVGDLRDEKTLNREALRVHVRKGAFDVFHKVKQRVAQFKRDAILKSLNQLKEAGADQDISSHGGLDVPRHDNLDEWTMVGFSQRSYRRRWLNLNQTLDHCRTHWLLQHKVVCVEINLDTPNGADPENQVIMHAGLDALIGLHGSQNVHSVWMPDRSYNLEILPHLIQGSWGGFTQATHTVTCNGHMIKNTKLNHVGYGLNETSIPNCAASEWKNVLNCNDEVNWVTRDVLVPPDMIQSFVEKFLLLPPGGTATTTPPRKCTEYDELANKEFVLYNVVCQDGNNSDGPITKQYYRPRTSFSHLQKRR